MKQMSVSIAAVVLVPLTVVLVACAPIQPLTATAPSASDVFAETSAFTQTAPVSTTAATGIGSGQLGPILCAVEFEATVRQGPSTGLTLTGIFDFQVDETGALHGTLLQENQGEISAAGQVNGRAIHLVFTAGEGKFVFGVGTAVSELASDTCGVALGGPFVGPEPGDAGDWLALGGADSPGSTPGPPSD